MAIPRLVGVAVAGIALLAVGAVAAILALTDAGPAAAPPPPPVLPGAAGEVPTVGSPSAPPSSNLPAGLVAGGVQVPVEKDPPPPRPPPGSWEAVPIAGRPASMGPAGPALVAELNDLHDALAACFEPEIEARHGQGSITAVKDLAPQDDAGATVLLLQVETYPGGVRIVDAPVEARGPAGDGVIACAQQVLRGRSFAVPAQRQSGRHRVLHTLMP